LEIEFVDLIFICFQAHSTPQKMENQQKIILVSIESKLPKVAFDLFRYWTKHAKVGDDFAIKSENELVKNLRDTISDGLVNLLTKERLDDKPDGWEIGYLTGFIMGKLGTIWHHDYIVKTSNEYKTFAGLRAIEIYLMTDEISKIKLDAFYEAVLNQDSNLENINPTLKEININLEDLSIVEETDGEKVSSILNNLIVKQIKFITKMENKVELPVRDYFSIEELQSLIAENKKIFP
jgi:hypothetical protein